MSTLKKPDLTDKKLRAKLVKGMGHKDFDQYTTTRWLNALEAYNKKKNGNDGWNLDHEIDWKRDDIFLQMGVKEHRPRILRSSMWLDRYIKERGILNYCTYRYAYWSNYVLNHMGDCLPEDEAGNLDLFVIAHEFSYRDALNKSVDHLHDWMAFAPFKGHKFSVKYFQTSTGSPSGSFMQEMTPWALGFYLFHRDKPMLDIPIMTRDKVRRMFESNHIESVKELLCMYLFRFTLINAEIYPSWLEDARKLYYNNVRDNEKYLPHQTDLPSQQIKAYYHWAVMEETQEKYKENPPSLKHLVGINPTLIVIDMEEIARNIVKFDDEETSKRIQKG